MAAKRIPDDVREAVAEAMRKRFAGKPTVRSIAAQFGISSRSVQEIAKAAGVHDEAARAQAKNAVEQVRLSNAQLRAEVSRQLLEAAQGALAEINEGSVITGVSFGEVVCKRVPHLTAKDRQALLTAAAIAMDKHKMIDAYDSASDNTDVAAWLEWMSGMPKHG